jgi:hypothetical protein
MVEQGSLTRVTTFHEEKDISIENRIQDFEENGYPLENSQKGPLSWFVDNSETKSEAAIRQTRSSDSPTTVDSSKNKSLPRSTFVKAFTSPSDKSSMKTIAAGQQQQQPVANIEDVLEPEDLSLEPEELKSVPRVIPKPRSVQDEVERELRIEGGRAWQFYGAAQTRILSQIAKAKDQRRHDLFLIDTRKKRLEQMQYDLTTREGRILESEPYLGLAKKLQGMELTLEDCLPWLETIKEVAQMQNMDIKTAAIYVATELREHRQYWGIQKQIERASQELALINMTAMQKQQALTVLNDLTSRGVTSEQIVQLIDFAAQWYNSQQPGGNGSSQQRPLMNCNNGHGDNLSTNDLIKLNMLAERATNMLNRVGMGTTH